jgi:hypothetical protein
MPWHVIVIGLVAGLPGILTSALITGFLFHPFQRHTPASWRGHEGPARYAAAGALKLVAGIFITLLVCVAIGVTGFGGPVTRGMAIGGFTWAAAALPAVASVGLFVNLHRGFIAGLLLDWLVVCVMAGGIAGWMLPS